MTKTTKKEPVKKESKKDVVILDSDCWMYNKDGATLFSKGDVLPAGYVDSPSKVK